MVRLVLSRSEFCEVMRAQAMRNGRMQLTSILQLLFSSVELYGLAVGVRESVVTLEIFLPNSHIYSEYRTEYKHTYI